MTADLPHPDQPSARADAGSHLARGRLKVFFGAVAGVGKTYAMLEEARARAAEGLDVVVGYVQPHARSETQAQLLGLAILPPRTIQHNQSLQRELDLDAALARKPALILVDELAHTNPPGLRHAKRWQDVMDLLDAGIDVYTTLGIEHLESVVDIVQRLANITVQQTLPDFVLDQADEVELIDISPEELLQRLAEGKIYPPADAAHAKEHLFSMAALYALREMALRRTADRVDAQRLALRRRPGQHHPETSRERILVCVGPSPLASRLVRAARRLAAGLKAQWIAANVETPAIADLPQDDRDRAAQTLRLAAQLGAQTVTLIGSSVAEELLNYARAHAITKIVIGRPEPRSWRHLFRKSVADELVEASGPVDIYVVRGEPEEPQEKPRSTLKRPGSLGYLGAALTVLIATAVGWLFYHGPNRPRALSSWHWLSNTNVLMLYLLAVLWTATRHGRGPAIAASILGVAAFDFCFVPPYLTFAVADPQYLVMFLVMLLTAVVISTLADRGRRQALFARQREQRTAALFDLSRQLASSLRVDDLIAAAARRIGAVFDADAAILLPDPAAGLALAITHGNSFAQLPAEQAVAQWVFAHGRQAGVGTATLSAAQGLYVPLVASLKTIGVLGLRPSPLTNLDELEQLRLLESFANQLASAIERVRLADEARDAWERAEAEFMRNTLLSSVSHDLRTPLAAITGAASSLVEGQSLDPSARAMLAQTILEESERMDRVIGNLLHITRLESGGLSMRKEWQPIHEVVGAALHHLAKRLGQRQLHTDLPPDLPMISIDAVAMEQVLINLVDNAIEHTPPLSAIHIRARHLDGVMTLEIADQGPGLPPDALEKIFEKFYRGPTRGRRGMGLGLAICKGLIQAHGGAIHAANRPQGSGALFTITLPIEGTPPTVDSHG